MCSAHVNLIDAVIHHVYGLYTLLLDVQPQQLHLRVIRGLPLNSAVPRVLVQKSDATVNGFLFSVEQLLQGVLCNTKVEERTAMSTFARQILKCSNALTMTLHTLVFSFDLYTLALLNIEPLGDIILGKISKIALRFPAVSRKTSDPSG
jgi:hypothetical protein